MIIFWVRCCLHSLYMYCLNLDNKFTVQKLKYKEVKDPVYIFTAVKW